LNETTQRGYFVHNLEDFDNTFFGISNKEAVLMDPQQRITVEVTWEALEDAGIPPQSLAGSNTAVFMGVNSDDYSKLLLEDLPGVEAWMGIGTAYCGVPNRISYLLDLRGPSTAVDAACASSLVAIHHGRQSLLAGETDVAIVGGVNALCGPGLTRVLDMAGAISKDGTCRSFDNEANGYGRGEGASVIILKRMSDAVCNNDRILAVLKGSAVGQDGRTNGIMAPNGEAQEYVARTALANIDPRTIQYVEAHATSTSVGDPVEIRAMSNVYGANREAGAPCFVGSIKPNVGHLEAGAGAVGFMKAVLAINKGIIPPQANLKNLNTKIDWNTAGIKVPFESTSWPAVSHPRRAAICSYGYGGTVSHAVIEAVSPQSPRREVEDETDEPRVLLLSGPQEKRIPGTARGLGEWMAVEVAGVSLSSIACTLATRRGHHEHRAAIIAETHEEAMELADALAHGKTSAGITAGRVLGKDEEKGAVWAFSGHGAQWANMGAELLVKEPVFRHAIADLEPIILAECGFSARKALETGDFDSSDKVQVLTYAMQIGLSALLKAKGAQPSAIIGHSVGEIAAAVVAGALTTSEGALVVCKRATLYRHFMGKGAMVLVNIPFEEMLVSLDGRLDIGAAIDSSPSSCVVSGSIDAVEEFSKLWQARGIKVLKVKSDIAFHSPVLNAIAAPLTKLLSQVLSPRRPVIPLYSTSAACPREEGPRDVNYWIRNTCKPVLLTGAIRAAAADGFRLFLEVSSHPVITHSVNETLMDLDLENFAVLPTLIRNKPTRRAILQSLVAMWCKGASINWEKHFSGSDWAESVPRTVWKHQSFWKTIETGATDSAKLHDVNSHTLLGHRMPVIGTETTVFTTKLDENTKPFPGHHPLHGTEIIPAAVLFNTFFHATGVTSLTNIRLHVPVAISALRNIQVIVQGNAVRLMSRLVQKSEDAERDSSASWLTHTSATTVPQVNTDVPPYGLDIDVARIKSRIGTELKPSFSIDYLADVGVSAMGFPWAVTHHVGNNKEMLATVDTCPSIASGTGFPWSASSWAPVFDAATSIGSTLFFDTPRLRMPAQVENVSIREGSVPPKIAYIYVHEASSSSTNLASDVTIADETGRALAKFTSMRFSEIEGTPGATNNVECLIHQLAWKPARLSDSPRALSQVVFVSSQDNPLLKSYQKQLSRRRIQTTLVTSAKSLSSAQLDSHAEGTIIMYLPGEVETIEEVAAASNRLTEELLDIVKYVATTGVSTRVYAVTDDALTGATPTALSHAPLIGLGRIIASEQPDLWGATIDADGPDFPFQVVKYISKADVVKVEDCVARVPRLRPIPKEKLHPIDRPSGLDPRPEGTYVISGGLGALGLEVAGHLVEGGARRIVLLSRRTLPSRKTWTSHSGSMREAVQKIQLLEQAGATVYSIALDLGASDAATVLSEKLEALSLPPVLGVVHAAGVVEDQLVLETTPESFSRVLGPKVAGTLALHQAFPPTTVDFFVLFSSCGQLFGFPGQASYASGNAFLDSMAEHRRALGDNAIALQWTSWRGLGMAASTPASEEFIEAELQSKGITSISRDEAFRAWNHVAKYDMSHGVVLRSLPLEADDILPMDILEDIVIRRAPAVAAGSDAGAPGASMGSSGSEKMPEPGPKRTEFLRARISECVASVLQLPSAEDVDPKAALSELGMDSVMTVALRRQLQQALKVKVPPTLVWGHPTVSHLTKWFANEIPA
jgi:6-methylsalicylic acid synthase